LEPVQGEAPSGFEALAHGRSDQGVDDSVGAVAGGSVGAGSVEGGAVVGGAVDALVGVVTTVGDAPESRLGRRNHTSATVTATMATEASTATTIS
jgi:hypothetical protein